MSPNARGRSLEQAEMLDWTARLGVVTAPALAALLRTTVNSAGMRLERAAKSGLLERSRPLREHPALFTITRRGLHAIRLLGLQPSSVSTKNAAHAVACAAVAGELQRAYPQRLVSGVPELRRRERLAGAPLASASMLDRAGGATLLHTPDLVLWAREDGCELPVAVEVELTVKAPPRLAAICLAWARCERVAGVLYVAGKEAARALAPALAKAQASGRILVMAIDDLLDCPIPRTVPGEAYGEERGVQPTSDGEPPHVLQHQPGGPGGPPDP